MKVGVNDLKHLSEKIAMRESSKLLINNVTDLAMLGSINIGTQFDTAMLAINLVS
jgi:hypothetical protein